MVRIGMMFKKEAKTLYSYTNDWHMYKEINDAYAQVVNHSFSWHFLLGYSHPFDIGVGIGAEQHPAAEHVRRAAAPWGGDILVAKSSHLS